jgi:hypothetical protein
MMEIIKEGFDAELKRVFAPKQELLKWLLNHERKKLCIENLTKEIRLVELSSAVKLDRRRILSLSADFARTFAKVSLNVEEQKNQTELKKSLIIAERDENDRYEAFFNDEVEIKDSSEEL